MIKFNFFWKGSRISFSSTIYIWFFKKKFFFMLYSINSLSFIVWLHKLFKILETMHILTICFPPVIETINRSRHWRCCVKKDVLRNFTKFTGKHLYQSLFFNRPATLLKKKLWHRCFPEFCETSKSIFFTEHLW